MSRNEYDANLTLGQVRRLEERKQTRYLRELRLSVEQYNERNYFDWQAERQFKDRCRRMR